MYLFSVASHTLPRRHQGTKGHEGTGASCLGGERSPSVNLNLILDLNLKFLTV